MSNKCLINVWNGVGFPNKKPNNFKILFGQTFFKGFKISSFIVNKDISTFVISNLLKLLKLFNPTKNPNASVNDKLIWCYV